MASASSRSFAPKLPQTPLVTQSVQQTSRSLPSKEQIIRSHEQQIPTFFDAIAKIEQESSTGFA